MDGADGNCLGKGDEKGHDQHDALGNSRLSSQKLTIQTSVPAGASHYKMTHKYRGKAIIFNHETFKVAGLKSRSGTQVDCQNIGFRLKKLGFDVKTYNDYSYDQISMVVRDAAISDHSDCDCFMMVVLSHGEMGILYAHDGSYKPDSLWSPFTADRCPSLAGKPKLFFVQACQGDQLDGGVNMNRTETDGHPPNNDTYRIPTQADFLIAYSTVPGYYSWRNTTRGSWFMQALCEELEMNGNAYDILTLLTFVNRRVAIDYESNTPDNPNMHRQKQIPCITTMLTRLLVFTNKGSGDEIIVDETNNEVEDVGRVRSKSLVSKMIAGALRFHSHHANSI